MRNLVFLASSLMLLTACSSNPPLPKTGSLSGKVMHDGKPLPGGSLTFHSKSGPNGVAPITSDGTFEVSGLPVGELTVSIETESIKKALEEKEQFGAKVPDPNLLKIPPEMKAKMDPALMKKLADPFKGMKYVPIPEKYTDHKKSGLTVTIQEGKQDKTFTVD